MSDWLVELASEINEYRADVELTDTIGPINSWRSRKAGAFSAESGTFTNQTQNAVDVGGDWELYEFDIDKVEVDSNGKGLCKMNAGDFPQGDLTWIVRRSI